MCGICGFVNYGKRIEKSVITSMENCMFHRGPNDHGHEEIVSQESQIVLVHNRLSIMDLSAAGHQPMKFAEYTIVYNGEVYNFNEIRNELILLGHKFVSKCDTEVILHAFKEWGMSCCEKFIGMFAFAIYDTKKNLLYLCRDRAGVKPLYYYEKDGLFAFASELKAILAIPDVDRSINYTATSAYFQLTYIPLDMCIFKYANKLLPGHWYIFDIKSHSGKLHKYWDIQDYYNKPKFSFSYDEAKEQLREILKSAFGYRMISDVPVGVFLSGGIDSSLVTAILMKELGHENIDTFTIGFETGNNEAPEAELISKHLGTNHTTRYCTAQDAINLIPQLPFYYDEPVNNPGAISFMLVSKLAKEKVVCALSGDGADEIFAGYDYYETYAKKASFIHTLNNIPQALRRLVSIPNSLYHLIRPEGHKGEFWVKLLKKSEVNMKNFILNHYPNNINYMDSSLAEVCRFDINNMSSHFNTLKDSPEFGMLFDFKLLMPDNYIVKIERGSMWCSLECREPFLDHRIAEFGAQLPFEFKYQLGNKKRILKDLAYNYIPKKILDKPKTGFVVPINHWLQYYLQDYVHETLSEKNVCSSGINRQLVKQILSNFDKGIVSGNLWGILQYQSWYNIWMNNEKN